jgi:sigma-B regulation protein RsbU (phosphoserine phosphatase)
MKFASILQRKMMKNETRNLQGSVATTFYSPFEYVGGDYSAVLPGNDRIYFISVDVVGHSIFSAFYSSMIHSSFYNLIFYPEELDDFIYRIYQEFVELMSDDNFLSMVAGYLIPSRKEVVFANYGHPYPALYLAKQRKTVLYNEVHNKIISPLIPFEKPKINCVSYEEGDKLFVYSDGLIEQENSDENKFSALTSALESYSSKLTGADLVNAVVKERILANAENSEEIRKELSGMDVMEWEQGTDYFDDDVSLIVFEF